MRLLFICFCLSLAASTGLAQSPADERARIHFEAGNSYYERGSHEDAAREFQLSFALSERPELLFSLFSSYEHLGQLAEAESALQRYIDADIHDDRRRIANERLESLRQRMRNEADCATDFELGAVDMEEAPEPASDEGRSGARKAGITLWVVGGVGLIDFAAFAVLSSSEANGLGTCSPNCSDAEVSRLGTYNVLADIGLAVDVAGILAGTVLWIVGKPTPVSVSADGTSASVQFTTSF